MNRFYLTQHIQNTVISTFDQLKNSDIFYILLFMVSLLTPVCVLYLQHISIGTRPISSSQWPHRANGPYPGQCNPGISEGLFHEMGLKRLTGLDMQSLGNVVKKVERYSKCNGNYRSFCVKNDSQRDGEGLRESR